MFEVHLNYYLTLYICLLTRYKGAKEKIKRNQGGPC